MIANVIFDFFKNLGQARVDNVVNAAKAKKAVKEIQSKVEKTTLGDLGVLAELKKKLEGGDGEAK